MGVGFKTECSFIMGGLVNHPNQSYTLRTTCPLSRSPSSRIELGLIEVSMKAFWALVVKERIWKRIVLEKHLVNVRAHL